MIWLSIVSILRNTSVLIQICFGFYKKASVQHQHFLFEKEWAISAMCTLKDELPIRGNIKCSPSYFCPWLPVVKHSLQFCWFKSCFLTLSWSWQGVDARHTRIKSHTPPPQRKIEKLYESCSPPRQQSPRYSLLHLDIHMETRGFLSSHSDLLNCLHKCG